MYCLPTDVVDKFWRHDHGKWQAGSWNISDESVGIECWSLSQGQWGSLSFEKQVRIRVDWEVEQKK